MTRIARVDLWRELRHVEATPASPALRKLRQEALALIDAEGLTQGMYCYRVVPVGAPVAGIWTVQGESLHAPRLIPESGRLTALAFAACTLGPAIEQRIKTLFASRKMALAITLDGLANELLSILDRRLQDRIQAELLRQHLSMAGELRAGDPGLDLSAQPRVLRLADAQRIGIEVSASLLLRPLKSLSGVLGVGKDLLPATWSRCDECRSREKCKFRTRARAAASRAETS